MKEFDKQLIEYLQNLHDLVSKNHKMTGFYYKSMYDFILKEGKTYESAELTKEEKEIFQAAMVELGFTPQKKQCFYNAQMLLEADISGQIKYVEGYAHNLIPVLHGWNEINGKVIDVTFDYEGEMIIGTLPEYLSYRGVAFDEDRWIEQINESGPYCSFIDDWENGFPLLKKKY